MIWYRYKDELLLPFMDPKEAIKYACTNQLDLAYFHEFKLHAMKVQQCLQYLEQVLFHCNNGHSLQNALLTQDPKQYSEPIRPYVMAIKTQLMQGRNITESISPFLPLSIRSFGKNIPVEGTEESKVMGLLVILDALKEQNQLTAQLKKCLVYPFSVIQSSMVLAAFNSLLNETNSTQILTIWLLVCLGQISLFLWINNGKAYVQLCNLLPSFRIRRTLMLLTACIKSGQPLHSAIRTLMESSSGKLKDELTFMYFRLLSGRETTDCLPKGWIPKQFTLSMSQITTTGDVITPLVQTVEFWKDYNFKRISWLSKAFPIVGIMIASIFVTQTLITLYAPLMESGSFGL